MRLSTYEIILPLVGTDEKPIEGYMLLTNGLYGAVDVVPKEDADKLFTHLQDHSGPQRCGTGHHAYL